MLTVTNLCRFIPTGITWVQLIPLGFRFVAHRPLVLAIITIHILPVDPLVKLKVYLRQAFIALLLSHHQQLSALPSDALLPWDMHIHATVPSTAQVFTINVSWETSVASLESSTLRKELPSSKELPLTSPLRTLPTTSPRASLPRLGHPSWFTADSPIPSPIPLALSVPSFSRWRVLPSPPPRPPTIPPPTGLLISPPTHLPKRTPPPLSPNLAAQPNTSQNDLRARLTNLSLPIYDFPTNIYFSRVKYSCPMNVLYFFCRMDILRT